MVLKRKRDGKSDPSMSLRSVGGGVGGKYTGALIPSLGWVFLGVAYVTLSLGGVCALALVFLGAAYVTLTLGGVCAHAWVFLGAAYVTLTLGGVWALAWRFLGVTSLVCTLGGTPSQTVALFFTPVLDFLGGGLSSGMSLAGSIFGSACEGPATGPVSFAFLAGGCPSSPSISPFAMSSSGTTASPLLSGGGSGMAFALPLAKNSEYLL